MARRRLARRAAATQYLGGSRGDSRRINWIKVAIATAVLALVLAGLILLIRGCVMNIGDPVDGPAVASPTSSATAQSPSAVPVTPASSVPPGADEAHPLDLSQDAEKVVSPGNSINTPGIFKNDMIFSAGSGSIEREAVLRTLYLHDLDTGETTEITTAQLKDGEIYDTLINEEYIVWLDTDQSGHNRIYFMYRHDEDEVGIQLVKESENALPKLRLSKDSLIFTEQYIDAGTGEKEEMLYHIDLITAENVALPNYTESIFGHETTYAVSAPDIHGDEVIWAAPDPGQTQADRTLSGERSLIFSCDLEQLKNDDYQPNTWDAGMYVHEPITNGRAWAWIDRNKAPDSSLWVKFGDEVVRVSTGVTSYCFGDDMLVYGKEGVIWVYFYETGMYGRITREGERGILPVATGRKVVWMDRTDPDGKDQLMIVYIQ